MEALVKVFGNENLHFGFGTDLPTIVKNTSTVGDRGYVQVSTPVGNGGEHKYTRWFFTYSPDGVAFGESEVEVR